jgi:m7GpppX diphosphatase
MLNLVLPNVPPPHDYVLVAETPEMYSRNAVASFIEQETRRPSKQWITSIIAGDQEREQVIVRTEEFVLLPDTERVNRYWRTPTGTKAHHHHRPPKQAPPTPRMTLNWLSIVNDLSVRTLRDLRGKHVPMLRAMLAGCMSAVETYTGIPSDQVMAYVHYPPSVYQLHVHFSYPYGQYCHRDAYRVHSLEGIINNLEIDPEYYAKSTLHLAMYRQSPHYQALMDSPSSAKKADVTDPPNKDSI